MPRPRRKTRLLFYTIASPFFLLIALSAYILFQLQTTTLPAARKAPIAIPAQLAVVGIESFNPAGDPIARATGFFIAPGRVVTCWHAIASPHHADSAANTDAQGNTRPDLGVLAGDQFADIILLAVQPRDTDTHLETTDDSIAEGSKLTILSNPHERGLGFVTVTADNTLPEQGPQLVFSPLLIKGMSGCPILDDTGRVVAVARERFNDNAVATRAFSRINQTTHDPMPITDWLDRYDTGVIAAFDLAMLANTAAIRGDHAQALRLVDQAIAAAQSDSYWVLIWSAYALTEAGEPVRATELLDRARSIATGRALFEAQAFANIVIKFGADAPPVIDHLFTAFDLNADHDAIDLHIGWFLREQAVVETTANEHLANPDASPSLRALAQAILDRDEAAIAQDRADRFAALFPDNPQLVELARTLRPLTEPAP